MLIVIGDDITDYRLQGYKNGACKNGEEIEGVSCTIERSERIFSDLLAELVDNYFLKLDGNDLTVSSDMFAGALSEYMQDFVFSDTGMLKYSGIDISYISDVLNSQRVFYLEFEITIPPGESINVTVDMYRSQVLIIAAQMQKIRGYRGMIW